MLGLGVDPARVYVDHCLTGTNRDRPGVLEARSLCRARCWVAAGVVMSDGEGTPVRNTVVSTSQSGERHGVDRTDGDHVASRNQHAHSLGDRLRETISLSSGRSARILGDPDTWSESPWNQVIFCSIRSAGGRPFRRCTLAPGVEPRTGDLQRTSHPRHAVVALLHQH